MAERHVVVTGTSSEGPLPYDWLTNTNTGAKARIRGGTSTISGSGVSGGSRVVTHGLGLTPATVLVTTHHALVIIAVTGWTSTQFSVTGVMVPSFGSFSTGFSWLVMANP